MRKTIVVSIVKKHWDLAMKSAWMKDGEMLIHDNQCPLALALREKLGVSARVNGNIADIALSRYTLDKSGADFVAVFDDHEEEYVPKFPVKVKLTLCQPEKNG